MYVQHEFIFYTYTLKNHWFCIVWKNNCEKHMKFLSSESGVEKKRSKNGRNIISIMFLFCFIFEKKLPYGPLNV
jgi:hypothetical protein